jgi:hypothetical protein
VLATRRLAEAWEREVQRTVTLTDSVLGEARIRQRLDTSLGDNALRALEVMLRREQGWTEVKEGYRHDVEGGYVVYHVDDRELEIVATLSEEVTVAGEAQTRLRGQLDEEISREAEGTYYDDAYAGRTRERAEAEARSSAEAALDRSALERLRQVQREAEAAAEAALTESATQAARDALARTAAQRQQALARRAQTHLEEVGTRARAAFHRVLGTAYREAILAYARRQGAQGVECRESDGVVEISFEVDA